MKDDNTIMTPTANDTEDGGVDDATLPILVSLWARLSDPPVPRPIPDSF